MKKFLLIALFLFFSVARADGYNLTFTDDKHIVYNDTVWQLAAQTNLYNLFVHKKSLNTSESVVEMTSMLIFHDPNGYKYNAIPDSALRIYTYGIIECRNGLLNLLTSWYVDKTERIIYTEIHAIDSYLVDLRESNTPRNDLFRLVCTKN